ncbi:MAG: preprotein translocase subunit SecG [Phycisphaeraceae bacterium]|nr:preprotein translocase subunit SecG [Phycisphaerae bacterium]MBX3392726.1 preprotein translocase subunit SecG [Phycisphaeraceae bacterium]HRJ49783.1 preprotein translocase subunit SecG [Phycisphaerales bacterium]
MVVWSLAMSLWVTNLLILVLLSVAVILILTVLIQRPQGGGLSAAFGSAGSGQTAFGTKTGDALTVFTVVMFSLFVLAAIGLNFGMRPGVPPPETTMQKAPGSLPVPGPGGSSIPSSGVTPAFPAPDATPAEKAMPADLTPEVPASAEDGSEGGEADPSGEPK